MGRRRARILSRSKSTVNHTLSGRTLASKKRKFAEIDSNDSDDENIDVNCKKPRQYIIKNNHISISKETAINTCELAPSPALSSPAPTEMGQQTPPRLPDIIQASNTFRFKNIFTTHAEDVPSTLPTLSWADSQTVWHSMMKKERLYTRDPQLFTRHPTLQPRMRAILFDWLMEVCEVYKLHRESFYLAVDYIDRYLSQQRGVVKQQLQLIGITAIFIASKLEEIYPPKLSEFAYVTDGACTECEILDQEMIMLKVLNWDLAPMTIQAWLSVYLQVWTMHKIYDLENHFVIPHYSTHCFVQITVLIDLCCMDTGSLHFTYSVIAASALYHVCSVDLALSTSGYKWHDIAACVQWMAPFALTIAELGTRPQKFFSNMPADDCHNIQTHDVDLAVLERAQSRQCTMDVDIERASPDVMQVRGILTPPQSRKKDCVESDGSYTPQSIEAVNIS